MSVVREVGNPFTFYFIWWPFPPLLNSLFMDLKSITEVPLNEATISPLPSMEWTCHIISATRHCSQNVSSQSSYCISLHGSERITCFACTKKLRNKRREAKLDIISLSSESPAKIQTEQTDSTAGLNLDFSGIHFTICTACYLYSKMCQLWKNIMP